MTIEDLFVEIDRHFLTESSLAFPIAFTEVQEQNEKWFTRRQLPDLFTSLREQGHLSGWEREVLLWRLLPQSSEGKASREKIDFVVTLDQQPIPLEVKTLYLGRQGNSEGLLVYFDKNPASGYIAADVFKLAKIGHGYCVLFVHPFPPNARLWSTNVERFAQKMASQGIEVNEIGIPDLKKYSPHLYIAKLEVSRLEG